MKYNDIKNNILEFINKEEPEYLPAERNLQNEFGTTRTTVRKVLNILVTEKRLLAEHGRGYRVLYNNKKRKILGKIAFLKFNSENVFENSVFRHLIDETFNNHLEAIVSFVDPHKNDLVSKVSKLLSTNDAMFINSRIIKNSSQNIIAPTERHRCVCTPYMRDVDLTSIYTDVEYGSYKTTEYLINLGHRKIALFSADPYRVQGYERALKAANIKVDKNLEFNVAGYRHTAFQMAGKIFKDGYDFSAVVCQNDLVALGLIEQCLCCGIKVGKELSIVGFDNIEDAQNYPVPLTTMGIDLKQMAKIALDTLLSNYNNKEINKSIKIKAKLIERESTCKI